MKVKVFDEMHEKDLEKSVNDFLDELDDEDIVDIKYEVSISMFAEEQIYCFSAMIVYKMYSFKNFIFFFSPCRIIII